MQEMAAAFRLDWHVPKRPEKPQSPVPMASPEPNNPMTPAATTASSKARHVRFRGAMCEGGVQHEAVSICFYQCEQLEFFSEFQ